MSEYAKPEVLVDTDWLEAHAGDSGQEPSLVAEVDVRGLMTHPDGFCHAAQAEAFGGFVRQHVEGGSEELIVQARADFGTGRH